MGETMRGRDPDVVVLHSAHWVSIFN